MPLSVYHALTATTPDDLAYEIRPSHFNSAHAITLAISGTDISGAFSNANGISFGISANQLTASYTVPAAGNPNFSAGTTSSALGSVVFSNSNGIGFGLNGSTITASYTVPGATVFSNSNNVSFGLNGSTVTATITVPAQTNQSLGLYGSSQTFGQSSSSTYDARSLSVVGSGNVSVGWSNSSFLISGTQTVQTQASGNIVGAGVTTAGANIGLSGTLNSAGLSLSGTVAAQSNQSAGIYASSQTFGQSSSSTHDARSLSIVGSGGVSVGWSNSSLLISGTTYPAQSVQPVAMSAQGGSSAFSTLIFTNSNNVSFSNTGGSVWGSYALNVSATGGTSNALSGLTFQDSNGVSFGLSTGAGIGSLTASIATTYAGTGVTIGSNTNTYAGTLNTSGLSLRVPYLTRYIWPANNLTPLTAPGNASQSIQYVTFPPFGMFLSRIDALVSLSAGSAATSNTAGFAFSIYCGISSKNGSTLSSIGSGSTQTTYTYASNSAGATYLTQGGLYALTCPLAASVNIGGGEYFVGFNLITNTTSIGAATTSFGLTLSMMGGNQINTAQNYNEFAATATSTNLYGGMGVYSAATTGMVTRVSLSAINQTGSALSAANIALVLRSG